MHSIISPLLLALVSSLPLLAAPLLAAPLQDARLQRYFAREVEQIESQSLTGYNSLADWESARPKLRAQLFEMLSLDPLPARADLEPVITGKIERDDFIVEKLHFQSSPGLYVTANFYLPKKIDKPLPTILYLCGHAILKTNGVSYGNKVGYQHHGAWFARNGYACLTIDTVQLGEIEGIHHGTYREGMWWWNSRGYTSAGIEAWNSIRALDYLETRPEVDKSRFGVTGRSGGGAYSWWLAALDDRVKVAAPVAGITDLRDHVIDGVVEGHCDCMYIVNTYRWDYPTVAALVAPRPLLIGNTDKDRIFPLDGVYRTHTKIARIYDLYGASTNLGLLITEGPHKDTQDLQLPVFRWFNRHLKGEDSVIDMAATKFFTGQELKVFDQIPEDETTSKIHNSFVPAAPPRTNSISSQQVSELQAALREKVFRGWPETQGKRQIPVQKKGLIDAVTELTFDSQEHVPLKILLKSTSEKPERIALKVVDASAAEDEINEWLSKSGPHARAVLFVRGIDRSAVASERNLPHVRRRYLLIGQTLDTMRVWDILVAAQVLGREFRDIPIIASASGPHAANLLLARIMNPDLRLGDLDLPPENERPDHLNLLRLTTWQDLERLAKSQEL